MKEGLYTKKLKADRVICSLCHHQCLISPDGVGLCKVRQNKEGKLYVLNYPKIVQEYVSDIEKIPFLHFFPGSKAYVIESIGENLSPREVSAKPKKATPEQLVKRALRSDCKSVVFSHNEPTMNMEMVLESAKFARSNKVKCAIKTNGYVQDRALKDLIKTVHAINLTLPTANKDDFYELTGGRLHHVVKNLQVLAKSTTWLEVSTELNEKNSSTGEMQKLVDLMSSVDKAIPWHLSSPPEFQDRVLQLKNLALEAGMKFVYSKGDVLVCPKTKKPLLDKDGLHIKKNISEFGKVKVEGIF